MEATVRAHPNIALVKYWGKRDEALRLPHTGSISITLGPMATTTRVSFLEQQGPDSLILNGKPAAEAERLRVSRFLDLFRQRAGFFGAALVESSNDLPTAAGVASSASAFAALTVAAAEALELRLSRQELSVMARLGSGSACRSIFGGYVEWLRGERADGMDSHAIPLAPASFWELNVLFVMIDRKAKPVGSAEGMRRTVESSSFYPAWVARAEEDLGRVREAITKRDLAELGSLAEANAMAMFGTMLAARPPLVYWQPGTLEVMAAVRRCRNEGLPVFFTIDAGPNVKVICPSALAEEVEGKMRQLYDVIDVFVAVPSGPPERLL